MKSIVIPADYDYVGVYLTDACHLDCPWCITKHHGAQFGTERVKGLSADQWIEGLNRLVLPTDVPVTLQGGEPFLYKGIWEILENVNHKIDILTALPPFITREHFLRLKTLDWNKRQSPYPLIRVSYHRGVNDYRELIERIADLNDILSIGLFYLEHPDMSAEEIEDIKQYAAKYGVELRSKQFLGKWKGQTYGEFLYEDAVAGVSQGIDVMCRNTVVPIAPDGFMYRCHSDLYFRRTDRTIGHILDESMEFPTEYLPCDKFGLCSECDVKIKTNRYQQFGYTSVDIKIPSENICP